MSKTSIKRAASYAKRRAHAGAKPVDKRALARLKRIQLQKLSATVKQLKAEIKELESFESGVEYATREKLAWDKDWDRNFTPTERARFQKAWHESFKASHGKNTPNPLIYQQAIRKARSGKGPARLSSPEAYLKNAVSRAYGYDNENNVIAIANRLKAEAGEYFEIVEPYYDYLMSHSSTMSAGVMQTIFELIYEQGITADTIEELGTLLPV